jgi:hypothetical protein
MIKRMRFGAGAAVAALLLSNPAWSAQVLAKDGKFEADVSARQMSRISIPGEKIVAIRKLDEPNGPQMLLETDDASGDAFVAFDGDVQGRAFSAFLTTESGKVVQAVLHPTPGEGQTIIVGLGGAGVPAGPDGAAGIGPRVSASFAGAPKTDGRSPYQEALVAFVRVMFNGDEVDGVTRTSTAWGPSLRAGPFSVRQAWAYDTNGLHGRVLYLTNLGKADEEVRLDAFLVDHVYAVAQSHERLRPGEQGRVFIVEEPR